MSCCKKHSLNRDSAGNGGTAFKFMDKEFLRDCEHFLPDPIEIPLSEKIESYPFLKYKLRIRDLWILFINSLNSLIVRQNYLVEI